MDREPIKVGMAEMQTAANPDRLITIGLGSCVGVCLWDPIIKIGGMVHVMLPDSTQSKAVHNKAKYADTGIVLLLNEMINIGAKKGRIIAKIAGGAQMFNFSQKNELLRIGDRNVEAVKKSLGEQGVRITAEDTGGTYGRTIVFYTVDAQLLIRAVNQNLRII